ncbi:hypothetical protein ACFPFV_12250 [Salinicoccus siamensis]|uniref:Uncharacterized protein n=1 Tax=Salinicoccus siamensis TaxID=381830 RepID=A0ABV5Z3F6_9STAP
MGLDMYLYLEDNETKEFIEYSYYRKFNALQGYFVDNFSLENCGKVEIEIETVSRLYILLNEIRYNPEKAEVLLPVYKGPFFGSYEYDKIYHNHINQAASDFYHAKFINYNRFTLYYTSNW